MELMEIHLSGYIHGEMKYSNIFIKVIVSSSYSIRKLKVDNE